MLNAIKNKNISIQNRYRIKEILPGQIVQLELKKEKRSYGNTAAAEIEVLRIDPNLTGRIIGKLVFYGFLPRKKGEHKEVLFSVDQIYRNYTLDPITVTAESYKGKKHNKDAIEFEEKRKPRNKSQAY